MLRLGVPLALLIVICLSSEVPSQVLQQNSTLPWLFPAQPSQNVDEHCMFDCARLSNYDNNCYWKCGIDPRCKWGSMLKCADARPDRQLNCVVDTGCLDFVQHYIRKKQESQGSHHSRMIISTNQITDLPLTPPPSKSLQCLKYVAIVIGIFLLLGFAIFMTWLSIRNQGKDTTTKQQPSQRIADCYVLLRPDQSVSDV